MFYVHVDYWYDNKLVRETLVMLYEDGIRMYADTSASIWFI